MAQRKFEEEVARIERWFRAALAAVEPAAAVRRHLVRQGRTLVVADRRIPVDGRLVVVSIGKAAAAMADGAVGAVGDLIDTGLILTKEGHAAGEAPPRFELFEAAHPIPDERGQRATRRALTMVEALGPGDVVLALISGGGSALFEAPRPPVTLSDLARTTDLLLKVGAPIDDLNAVRTPLSLVKGGRFRQAAHGAHAVTLILSDVLGNDPRVIASGPTIPSPAGIEAAFGVLDRYGLRDAVPGSVLDALMTLRSEPPDERGSDDIVRVVGDNAAAVAAARLAAVRDGYRPAIVWSEQTGEASELGRRWVLACGAAPPDVGVLLGGGEATVTVRGDGVGGRNTEFALAAALELAARNERDWVVASLATDGDDGPTGAAGAVADAGTVARAWAAGVDPAAGLARNDSLRVFAAAGGLVGFGPTGTNVNDLYVAVRR